MLWRAVGGVKTVNVFFLVNFSLLMYRIFLQVSQLFKIGSLNYEDVKQFSCCVEEALFRLSAHRDRALTYKMEEVPICSLPTKTHRNRCLWHNYIYI